MIRSLKKIMPILMCLAIISCFFICLSSENTYAGTDKLKSPVISSIKTIDDISIKVSWNKVSAATKYYVYRSTSKYGKYVKVATVQKSKTYYIDKKIKNKVMYYYKVKSIATKIENNSSYSQCKNMKVHFSGGIESTLSTKVDLQKGAVGVFNIKPYGKWWERDNGEIFWELLTDGISEDDINISWEEYYEEDGSINLFVFVNNVPDNIESATLCVYISGHKDLYKKYLKIYFDNNDYSYYQGNSAVIDIGTYYDIIPDGAWYYPDSELWSYEYTKQDLYKVFTQIS
ncbi:MAG: hypothetical protein RR918_07860, partial [Anaerovoracaceae bacterium]